MRARRGGIVFTVQWLKGGRQIHREAMQGASMEDVIGTAKDMLPQIARESGAWADHIAIFDGNRTVMVKAETSAAWLVWAAICIAAAMLSIATFIYFQRRGWPDWMVNGTGRRRGDLRPYLMAAPMAFIFGMCAYIFRNRSPKP